MQQNEESNQRKRKDRENPRGFCPFVQDPPKDCYCFCFVLGSQKNIRNALYYCQENYEKCELFQRLLEEKDHAQDTCG